MQRKLVAAVLSMILCVAFLWVPASAQASQIPQPTLIDTSQPPTNLYSPISIATIPGTNNYMVSFQGSNVVRSFNPSTGAFGPSIAIPANSYAVAVTPDAQYVLATGWVCACVDMIAIDDPTDRTTINFPAGSGITGITIGKDGTKAYVYGQASGYVYLVDLTTKSYTGSSLNIGGSPFSGAISPDGDYLFINRLDTNRMARIHTTDFSVTEYTISGDSPVWGVFAPDGSHLYVTSSASSSVYVYETVGYTIEETISVGEMPWGIAISPDGSTLVVDNRNGHSLSLIATSTNTVFQTIELPVGSGPWVSAFSENGQYLTTVMPDNSFIAVSKLFADPLPDTGAATGAMSLTDLRLTALAVLGLIAVGASLVMVARRRSRVTGSD